MSTVVYLAAVMNVEEHGPYFPESGMGRVRCCLACANIMSGAVLQARWYVGSSADSFIRCDALVYWYILS